MQVRLTRWLAAAAVTSTLAAGCQTEEDRQPISPGARTEAITVTPAAPSLAVGTTVALTAMARFDDDSSRDVTGEATWSSSDDAIATVSDGGVVQGEAAGAATITATFDGKSAEVSVQVREVALDRIEIAPASPSVPVGMSEQLTATGTYEDDTTQNLTDQVDWSSSDEAIASVDEQSPGRVTGAAAGTVTITARLGDQEASVEVEVTQARLEDIEISHEGASVAVGLTRQLTASGIFSDGSRNVTEQVQWSSSDEAIATVSNDDGSRGLLTAISRGTVTISATLGDARGTTTIEVSEKELVELAISPSAPTVAERTTAQLTATGTFTDESTEDLSDQVTWASSNTDVAAIDPAGLVEGLAAGTTQISAALDGEADAGTPHEEEG